MNYFQNESLRVAVTSPLKRCTEAEDDLLAGDASSIELGPQRRLGKIVFDSATLLVVKDGAICIDASIKDGQRQILDFLQPGDIVPGVALSNPKLMSVRALVRTVLVCVSDKSPLWQTRRLFLQLEEQFARSNQHRMMIGCLDAQARVASFFLDQAMRTGGARTGRELFLPMSREDIADFLAINRDTLSRVTKRFETTGLIERLNRHSVVIRDVDRLAALTPIAHLRRPVAAIDAVGVRSAASGATPTPA